jgi:hypothetical protein
MGTHVMQRLFTPCYANISIIIKLGPPELTAYGVRLLYALADRLLPTANRHKLPFERSHGRYMKIHRDGQPGPTTGG